MSGSISSSPEAQKYSFFTGLFHVVTKLPGSAKTDSSKQVAGLGRGSNGWSLRGYRMPSEEGGISVFLLLRKMTGVLIFFRHPWPVPSFCASFGKL